MYELTMECGSRDDALVQGITGKSVGLWNNRCAIERSTGFVSVSISIYPVQLTQKITKFRRHEIIVAANLISHCNREQEANTSN